MTLFPASATYNTAPCESKLNPVGRLNVDAVPSPLLLPLTPLTLPATVVTVRVARVINRIAWEDLSATNRKAPEESTASPAGELNVAPLTNKVVTIALLRDTRLNLLVPESDTKTAFAEDE